MGLGVGVTENICNGSKTTTNRLLGKSLVLLSDCTRIEEYH